MASAHQFLALRQIAALYPSSKRPSGRIEWLRAPPRRNNRVNEENELIPSSLRPISFATSPGFVLQQELSGAAVSWGGQVHNGQPASPIHRLAWCDRRAIFHRSLAIGARPWSRITITGHPGRGGAHSSAQSSIDTRRELRHYPRQGCRSICSCTTRYLQI